MALSPCARMSKIKNGGLDQYGAEALEQQQFGTAGIEGVKKWPDDIVSNDEVSCRTCPAPVIITRQLRLFGVTG